ncbi:MAG: adenylyl cyclase, partial [Gammaproteobacteria bacterium]
MNLFGELKRRNVFRVGIAYVLLGWVVMQAADFALDLIDAPNWIIQVFFIAGLVGLPFALFFAWAFEVTPEGIKREAEVDRSASITPTTGRKLDRAIIVFLALAVALLLGDRFFMSGSTEAAPRVASPAPAAPGQEPAAQEPEDQAPTDPKKSVAVLAFENMSPDAENEYFADGVSEEILNVLADLPELRVIARTSAFSFKGSDATVAEIAEKLDVGYVLEGSVRKAGDRVRVTAQL